MNKMNNELKKLGLEAQAHPTWGGEEVASCQKTGSYFQVSTNSDLKSLSVVLRHRKGHSAEDITRRVQNLLKSEGLKPLRAYRLELTGPFHPYVERADFELDFPAETRVKGFIKGLMALAVELS